MPALTADIAAGTRAAQVETWSNAAILSRYPSARDGNAEPSEGLFDSAADAATAITARGALVGVDRRRFLAPINDVVWIDPATGVPTFTAVDPEQSVNGPAMPMRIELDLATETTKIEVLV